MRRKTFQEPSNKAPLKGRGDEAGEGSSKEGGEITPLRRASQRAAAAAAAGEEHRGEVRQSAGENGSDSGGGDKSRVT